MDREALPPRPIRPTPQLLSLPSLDRLGRRAPRASPDATELQVRKALPDLRGHRDRRVSPALRENPGATVLRGQPAPSARRALPDRPVLLAVWKHARQRRDNPVLPARLGLMDRQALRVLKARKVWQGIRAPRGLRAPQGREENKVLSAQPVLQAL